MPADAGDASHQVAEPGAVRNPARGAALAQPAEIHELHVEPADRARFAEHLALQPAGGIPGRLPAHGGIERKDQPAALAGFDRGRKRAGTLQECIDLGTRRRRGRLVVCPARDWCLVAFRRHLEPVPGAAPGVEL
jgi:hypothetical protein